MNGKIDELLKILSYEFNDISLLKVALTHSSYQNENKIEFNNERLEFLGDAVLDLLIGEYFFKKFKEFNEGLLSKLRARVVNEDSLYEVALSINLGKYIQLGQGEFKNGGNRKSSILSNALEALIGAIYIDSSIDTTKQIIMRLFKNRLSEVVNEEYTFSFKSVMQEYAQKQEISIRYELYDAKGPDNDKMFYTNLIIGDEILGSGYGKSKKKSEQMAAYNALKKLGEIDE
ncbi:ribonuclease III [Peptoniphilus sp. ING2-D1G]|nr:ribonuclease III [Peptoniphilus sp. ING2-D1G]